MGDVGISTVALRALNARGIQADSLPPAPYVLVVDDDVVIADTLAAILRAHGYAVAVAYDAFEALELAKLAPPEIALSDVFMPGMDGVELSRRLAALEPSCRMLLLSGQPNEAAELQRSFLPEERFPILGKPVAPDELLNVLARLRKAPQRAGAAK